MPVPQSGHEYVDFPAPLISTLLCAGSLGHLVDIYSKRSLGKLMSLNIWIPLCFVGACFCSSTNRGLCEEGSCQLISKARETDHRSPLFDVLAFDHATCILNVR